MLREQTDHNLMWCDKTMSVLRTRQLEACAERMKDFPPYSVYDDGADPGVLDRLSFDGMAHPFRRSLPTLEGLRTGLEERFLREAMLLSRPEELLLQRALFSGLRLYIEEGDDLESAECLVRRLWGCLTRENDLWCLTIPGQIGKKAIEAFGNEQYMTLRRKLALCYAHISAQLYLSGMMRADHALDMLHRRVLIGSIASDMALATRFLQTTFDYTYDNRGEMVLLHPGLIEPDLTRLSATPGVETADWDENAVYQAAGGILEEELPAYDMMLGLLRDAVRPEVVDDENAVEDLRMLFKQGVPYAEVEAVLPTLLTVLPTPAMKDGLKLLDRATPRWPCARRRGVLN